jgi:DNA-binding MarR family transcriptional regulator
MKKTERTPATGKDDSRPRFLLTRRLNQVAVALFLAHTREINLTPVQFTVLRVMQQYPGSDQKSIAARAVLDASTTANVLKRLQMRGIVTRKGKATDGRAIVVTLTKAGEDLLARSEPLVHAFLEELLRPLSAREQAALFVGINKILRAYEQANLQQPFRRFTRVADDS